MQDAVGRKLTLSPRFDAADPLPRHCVHQNVTLPRRAGTQARRRVADRPSARARWRRTREDLQANAHAAFTALKHEAEISLDNDWRDTASPGGRLAVLTLLDLTGRRPPRAAWHYRCSKQSGVICTRVMATVTA
jgi:hypothetical protein